MKNTHTCDCSGTPVQVGNDTASRFEHNTTLAHRLAVLAQCGAPQSEINAVKAEYPVSA